MLAKIYSLAAIAFICFIIVTPANAAGVSFTGTFQQDDNVRLFTFNLASSSTVTLETWSYAGGTDAQGTVIPSGGFQPYISLFSGSGTFINTSVSGSCPPQNVDLTTGVCGDDLLSQSLAAGNYLVALTEYPNLPAGTTLAAGFSETGQGNFTGGFCGTTGAFFDSTCTKRNGNFELDLLGVTSAASVPEPANLCLLGLALLSAVALIRHRVSSRS